MDSTTSGPPTRAVEPSPRRRTRGGTSTTAARPRPDDTLDAVRARLAECWDGPGALVRGALAGGDWTAARSWSTGRGAGQVFHVKLLDSRDDGWIVVELLLPDRGRSELVWASATGGAMTECTRELARWLSAR